MTPCVTVAHLLLLSEELQRLIKDTMQFPCQKVEHANLQDKEPSTGGSLLTSSPHLSVVAHDNKELSVWRESQTQGQALVLGGTR